MVKWAKNVPNYDLFENVRAKNLKLDMDVIFKM